MIVVGLFRRSKDKSEESAHKGVEKMKVNIPDDVKETIGKRGIKVEEIQEIIDAAESTKKKLVSADGSRNLAKKQIGDVTIYADYSIADGEAKLNTAYSHRIALGTTVNMVEPAPWKCAQCNEDVMAGHVNMSYMQVDRVGPALICPKCNDSWVEEYLAINTLAAVEGLFEKKRA